MISSILLGFCIQDYYRHELNNNMSWSWSRNDEERVPKTIYISVAVYYGTKIILVRYKKVTNLMLFDTNSDKASYLTERIYYQSVSRVGALAGPVAWRRVTSNDEVGSIARLGHCNPNMGCRRPDHLRISVSLLGLRKLQVLPMSFPKQDKKSRNAHTCV